MLERRRRIHTGRDHRAVWKTGWVVRSRTVVLRYVPAPGSHSRYGFVVSSAIARRATVRNLIKRRLRSIARQAVATNPIDVVVYATKAATTATFIDLKQDLLAALNSTSHAPTPSRRH